MHRPGNTHVPRCFDYGKFANDNESPGIERVGDRNRVSFLELRNFRVEAARAAVIAKQPPLER